MSKDLKRTIMLIPVMLVLIIGIFGVSKVSAYVSQDSSINESHNECVQNCASFYDAKAVDNGQWVKNSHGNWLYKLADGSYFSNGYALIKGEIYHFNTDGIMTTGWLKYRYDEHTMKWNYMGKSGNMQFGWHKVGKYWYYMSRIGIMNSNILMDERYLFDSSGRWLPEAKWRKSRNGKWWYGYKDTYLYDTYVYFNNQLYIFDYSGYMYSGWFKLPGDERWYYANSKSDSSGPEGSVHGGWKKINGKWYYFNFQGWAYTNGFIDGEYCLSYTGEWMPDAKWQYSNGKWWYGSGSGYLKDIIITIDGKGYYFDENGWMMADGWYRWHRFSGYKVYASKSGALANGWTIINGKKYYFQNYTLETNMGVDGIMLGPDGAAIE